MPPLPLEYRTAPADVVRRCKEASPRLDAVYLGNGMWGIVEYSQKGTRIQAGREWMAALKARGRTSGPEYQQAHLMALGWSLLWCCPKGEPVETDIRMAGHLLTIPAAAVAAALDGAADRAEKGPERREGARIRRDFIRTEYRDAHRHVTRGRVSVSGRST